MMAMLPALVTVTKKANNMATAIIATETLTTECTFFDFEPNVIVTPVPTCSNNNAWPAALAHSRPSDREALFGESKSRNRSEFSTTLDAKMARIDHSNRGRGVRMWEKREV